MNSGSPLSPLERISEILFGLVMVLTFTGSLSVAEDGQYEVRAMLLAAVGCNFAWGLIDALMYLMTTVSIRIRGRNVADELFKLQDSSEARRVLRNELPEEVEPFLDDTQLDVIIERVRVRHSELPKRRLLTFSEIWGSCLVFALVFVATFPPLIPFILGLAPESAMRWSNGIAVTMLFALGYWVAQYARSHRPWLMGLVMMFVGATVVSWTIALGG